MSQIELKIIFDKSTFPMLFKLKDDAINNVLIDIFKLGYNCYFPSNNSKNIKLNNISNKLEQIIKKHDDIQPKSHELIEQLELNLNKLIGISSNSSKKGAFAENILEEIFNNRYGDMIYEKKQTIAHSGDAWIYLPDNNIIMLESKNYTTTINKDEIIKFQYDMVHNHIKYGLLLSFNSMIQGMKEFDILTFIHNNEKYSIITISYLINDIHKLDIGLQIIRKIIISFTHNNNYDIVINNISENLNELNLLIQQNYLLRDNFYNMEQNINKLLSTFHTNLRNYQYDIDKKINNIISNIIKINDETKKNSHYLNDNNVEQNLIINKYKNYKVYSFIIKIIDVCINKKWNIFMSTNNNEIIIHNIGIIKIQQKKIILTILSNSITLIFNIDHIKQSLLNLELLSLLSF